MVHKSSALASGSSGGTGGGIVSINSDTTPAQVIAAGSGISIGTSAGTTTISAIGGGSGTVTNVSGVTANGFAFSISNPTTTPAITANTTATGILQGNAGAISAVTIGSGLSFSGNVLSSTSSSSVSSVFGRVGAVTAQWNDYQFNLIGGAASISQGGTGQTSLTAHSVLLGEGAIAGVGFATTGTAARILIDQGNSDPAFKVLTGDSSLLSTGAMVNIAVNSVAYPSSPATNTVPVVTSSNQVTYEQVPNAALLNSAITIGAQTGLAGGGTVALGSAITLSMGTSIANSLAGYNSSGVFSDVSIGSNLSLSGGVLSATAGSGAVSSVFTRTGAVIAVVGDYGFSLISGTAAVSQGGTGATSFTAHSVLLGEGSSAVSVATTGISARLLIDQGSGSDPSFKTMSGDTTITNTGAVSIKSDVALTGNPTANTQAVGDNSTRIATDAFVTTAINNAIAGVNPAVAVQFATTLASDTSGLTYNNGASGIGATFTGSNNVAFTADGQTATALLQRVLIKNDTQSPSGAFNGVYYVSQLQTAILPPILTRALDYDQPSDINNTGAIPVINGTLNTSTSWVLTSSVTTVGTNPLTYTKFTLNPTTIITTSTAAGGSLAGTYPNPTLAIGAISGGASISISTSGAVTGITYTGSATGVSSISNTDGGSLTITPQTGNATANLNTSHANTWTATQTGAVSGGITSFISTGSLEFGIFANGNSGAGTPTIKWENGNLQAVTITGACTLGFTNPTHPTRLTIISTMSATSGYPYTYAGTVLWPSGIIPTLSSISNAIDITSFIYDGVNVYGMANTNFLI